MLGEGPRVVGSVIPGGMKGWDRLVLKNSKPHKINAQRVVEVFQKPVCFDLSG